MNNTNETNKPIDVKDAPVNDEVLTKEAERSANDEAAKKRRSKKRAKNILIIVTVLIVILGVLNSIDYDGIIKSLFGEDRDKYMEFDYHFYPVDYETDILKDESYLSLDRTVSYTKGAVKTNNVDLDEYPGCSVIKQYLQSMINGDAKTYNSLFTDEYYQDSKHTPLERFPQQRLYNIKVTLVQEPYSYTKDDLDGKYTGIIRYLFTVEYYIQYNTGTVRNDIPSDSSRELYVEVFEYQGGSLKINNMYISAYKG